MLRFCAMTIRNYQLKHSCKLYKHSKYKNRMGMLAKTLTTQPNPKLSHAFAERGCIRRLHTNHMPQGRVFRESENFYAYQILQKMPITDPEVFRVETPNNSVSTLLDFNALLDQDWRSKSASEIVEAFKSALNYCVENNVNVSDARFDKLVDGFVDHVQDLQDRELSELFSCLEKYPVCDSYAAHNFHDLWSALDDYCCWKLNYWPTETRFLFAEHWYRFNLARLSQYLFNFIDKMQKRLKYMNKTQLLHMLFLTRANKGHPVTFELQDAVNNHISSMSLEEIALAAMTLKQKQKKIKYVSTSEVMIQKLKQELTAADSVCVSSIVELLKILAQDSERLTKAQLIHIFFYINVCRKQTVHPKFESALEKYIYDMNVDEMAIVAMGFFKSQSRIRMRFLLGPIIEQTRKEARTIHEITLTSILKALRYSNHVLLIDQLLDLLDHLVPEIHRLSNICCIHIALLGTTLQFFHEASLERVSQKVLRDITDPQKIRLKDLERLLVPLTMFSCSPKTDTDIYEAIFAQLHTEERRNEVAKYPRCLPSALSLLSMQNIYSYELMNEILNMDSVIELYGKSPKTLLSDVLCLDISIDIDCPDYTGNRLDKSFRHRAAKWSLEYTPSENQHKKLKPADKFFLDVLGVVSKIVGPHNLHPEHVLPNVVKPDIIICKDKDGNFVKPTGFEKYALGDVMRPLNSDLRWLAVVPVNWNGAIKNDPVKPLGLIRMKCRQLKRIGYEPVLVLWSEYQCLSDQEKIKYVGNKIR